ncbi:unnamed protein product [Prunus armeniaca]|uniref:Reverse transcriptase domain-containing protein n=1 Tax=Prunus armeniaca TaxID=36596 RepID=A0A6J5TGP5_PRUAR|nr:unnamed protein product [Prunus armeniaca]
MASAVYGDRTVRRIIEDYFKNIFSSSGPRNWGSAINCIEKVVTLQMNLELIQPVLLKKVKKAAFEMGSLKAPGPNGFQGTFY